MAAKKTPHLFTALLTDAVLIGLFSVIGYWTHARDFDPAGIVGTAWPFLAALVLAWILNAVWADPLAPLRTGVGIWATTVLGGMVIRALIGDGTAGAFIVTAAALNLLTIVGWRILARAVAGRGARGRR